VAGPAVAGRGSPHHPTPRSVQQPTSSSADELTCLLTVRGEAPVAATSVSRRLTSRVVISLAGRSPSAAMMRPLCAPPAAAVRRARFGERVAVVAQRRRLGAAHAVEPIEVGVGHRAELRRSVRGPLSRSRALGELALHLPHEPILGDDCGVLVEITDLRAAPAPAKLASRPPRRLHRRPAAQDQAWWLLTEEGRPPCPWRHGLATTSRATHASSLSGLGPAVGSPPHERWRANTRDSRS
jgi:hypothetical protein